MFGACMIDLHYVRTSNGLKIAIMLEEIQIPYQIIEYDIFAGDHLKPRFKTINPNQKLPAIVDHRPHDGGAPFAVFETGAILLYLAKKTGKLLPGNFRRQETALQWLTWQVAGLGPMLGQAYHFVRYAPAGQEYGIQRYTREATRLLSVLDSRLSQEEYLATDYSIADVACWPWVQNVANIGLQLAAFTSIWRWSELIKVRPAVLSATQSNATQVPAAYLNKRMTLTATQWNNLFGY
jgi:GSH-dependent disulfide-bond oxidoreductase